MMTPIEIKDYLNLHYPLLIIPDDEGYGIEVPDLPGCYSHAQKWEDIQPMIREAMSLWINVMLEDGKVIPTPSRMAVP